MKIVDASPWEKRNLGMNAWEITLNRSDMENVPQTVEALRDPKFADAYVCVKLPVGNLKMVHALEDDGFRFVETQTEIGYDFKTQKLPAELGRYASYLAYEEVLPKSEQWSEVVNSVTDDMFITDRMYLDPTMPRGVSVLRYRNWMRDMQKDDSKVMLLWRSRKTREVVGFDIMASMVPIAHALLGGVFPGKPLMGMVHMCSFFGCLREKGALKYVTNISSNNLPMLRCYAQLGAIAQNMSYVFRKCSDQ